MACARHDVGIYLRRLRQPNQSVAGEVLLLNYTLVDIYLSVKCGTERTDHSTFYLLRNDVWVNHGPRSIAHFTRCTSSWPPAADTLAT